MNTKVTIAGVEFKNPVMTASGTFGSGMEYEEFVDINRLGAVVTKGVSAVPWTGNETPRVAETYGGMLNAIGLQNPGIDLFLQRDLPFLKEFDTKVIVNVAGHTIPEYIEVVERLSDQPVQLSLFDEPEAQAERAAREAKERRQQQAILSIRKKFGKNAIVKAMNLQEAGTAMDRNQQVGGHKA